MTQSNSDNRKKTVVIVALLLALVLLLGIGGYTLAKYITSGSGDGTATVAKWGYTVNVDTSNLFGKNYKASAIQSDDADVANLDVASTSDVKTNVVAPGTTGSMTIKIAGKAEVAAKLNIAIENAEDISLTLGENVYYPVKWTLNDGTKDLVEEKTLADVKTALEAENQTVKIGTELDKTYTLTWKWDFENATKFNDIEIDTLDTALGQLASGQTVESVKKATDNTDVAITASNLTVKFTVKVSIEQIQKAN